MEMRSREQRYFVMAFVSVNESTMIVEVSSPKSIPNRAY